MKRPDILMMIQDGFGKISSDLLMVEKRLEKVESLITGKNFQDSETGHSPVNPVENFNPNERLNKVQAAKILDISVRTLDRYRKKGIITYNQYADNGRISFRYKDIANLRGKVKGNNHGRDHFSELISLTNE